ncbi:unnamed protein product [Rhizophagus irregularis]|uniref:Uncharacterized protein n=1 Tax=Rhizophagus irregularis TaxID=588596 RepID=A0A916E8Z2_9GLOM|nr:unnamed protein product [Rhizophagus irregularis]CAB5143845.1 unnamed protein product [Rhizophagus irregularis]CAB5371946.1 unnamed protein product [Rhizophagus irregularis]
MLQYGCTNLIVTTIERILVIKFPLSSIAININVDSIFLNGPHVDHFYGRVDIWLSTTVCWKLLRVLPKTEQFKELDNQQITMEKIFY